MKNSPFLRRPVGAQARAQRRHVADASHELRTPLTNLRMNHEKLRDEPGLSIPDKERPIPT